MPAKPDDRLIVALDVPTALAGLELARRLGPTVHFYKIGLGMLTGGGLALANELKQDFGKRIFLDMKLFDIGATIETRALVSPTRRAPAGRGPHRASSPHGGRAARPPRRPRASPYRRGCYADGRQIPYW